MPAIYQCSYQVRHCECDAFGLLSPVSSLRYLQETAYGASADVGYGMVRYQQEGRFWYIRETKVEFLSPVHYGQAVDARSWVMDFHRVRSLRAYDLRINGNPVIDAWSDWVYLDSNRGRPISVPPEMMLAFRPEGSPTHPRSRFPSLSIIPPCSYKTHHSAKWGDLDAIGHVNNALYLDFIENNRRSALASIGWIPERFQQHGIDLRLRRIHMEYRQPAYMFDNLVIQTWFSDMENGWLRWYGSIYPEGSEENQHQNCLFQMHAWLNVINLDSLQPVEWPGELVNDLHPLIFAGDS
jgi:medium-chain acyl-[acyl-carrier-protein] hydrolase